MATATKNRQFSYTARDASGKSVQATLDAPSEQAVASFLKENGLTPLTVVDSTPTGLKKEIKIPGMGEKIGLKDIAVMARQLATMIGSGLSLLRALSILVEQTENPALAKVLGEVRNDVEQGRSFSGALGRHPKVFPPLMINMVKAGEVGGFLDETLVSIAQNFEDEVKLRGKVKSAMAYPVVVLVIAILASLAMLLFIIPVFAGMFADMGAELPAPTQFLITLSDFMKVAILPLIVVAIIFSFWWRSHKNDRWLRERLDPIKLKAPVFGPLMKKIAIARFARNLSSMLAAGVPILQALGIVGEASGNVVVERATEDIQDAVRRGRSITSPLQNSPVFPPMVAQMMAVGEDTGALDEMMGKVADFYDQEIESTTEQLTSLIEPIMIMFVGVIVGGMVICMYLPMFSVYDQIS
ncbi:type II secretion system F family protein [uncultured Demequina sp.]|uniref:type II secretion system F family protein n=1 Tax=uncultured Demequina sp. TaxID=693499 RepID=UPI0025F38664|nr:type II secretion system F family protein [uncultured Demequina sp.]